MPSNHISLLRSLVLENPPRDMRYQYSREMGKKVAGDTGFELNRIGELKRPARGNVRQPSSTGHSMMLIIHLPRHNASDTSL
jgi:hypothetical protein